MTSEDLFLCDGRCDEMGCRGHSFDDFVDHEERLEPGERERYERERHERERRGTISS